MFVSAWRFSISWGNEVIDEYWKKLKIDVYKIGKLQFCYWRG